MERRSFVRRFREGEEELKEGFLGRAKIHRRGGANERQGVCLTRVWLASLSVGRKYVNTLIP